MIADHRDAARRWYRINNAIQINHMALVKSQILQQAPDAIEDLNALFRDCRSRVPHTPDGPDMHPIGINANRCNLQVAIDAVSSQGLIREVMTVDELFDDVTSQFV